ncbi:MAG TPA: hypothetical protein VM166_00800 [Gemmatimonadaceae bacterium]|nr:hypothetical protein [Gemmatimonadaceae bacterium]
MLRLMVVIVALCVRFNASAAQDLSRPALGFGSTTAAQTATPSLPPFLQAGQERQSLDFNRQFARSLKHEKQCPMPVYRPDTSRHDVGLPVRVSAAMDPGIIAVINCPNPLDVKASAGPFAPAEPTPRPKAPGIF